MKHFLHIILASLFILFCSEYIIASITPVDSVKSKSSTFDSAIDKNANKTTSSKKASVDSSMIVQPDNPITPGGSLIKILIDFLVIFLAFILGGFFIYLFLKSKIISILHEEKDDYLSEIYDSNRYHLIVLVALFEHLKLKKDKYKQKAYNQTNDFDNESIQMLKLSEENRELKRKNQDLERTVSELDKLTSDTPVQKGISNNDSSKTNNSNYSEKTVTKKGPTSIFFTIPENDGSFSIEKGENISGNRKFYRIDYEENSDQGLLFFLPGENDIRAINYIDSYLIPVCEVENLAISSTATRIVQLKTGSVVKISDKWVIDKDKKVKVKLV